MSRSIILSLLVTALGCGGKNPAIKPTPVPPGPSLTCPADLAAVSHFGRNAPVVSFEPPSVHDGQEPVRTVCTPAAGSEFPNGTTAVLCQAIDGLSRTASCSFSVAVTPIPRLQRTKFLAFGDSLTESKIVGILKVPAGIFNQPGSYPERLNAKLSARYEDQQIEMIADGWGGERATDQGAAHQFGATTFKNDLIIFNPEVVLLLEGTNDMTVAAPASFSSVTNSVIDGLRAMTRDAKVRGIRVFVGSIPPVPANAASADAVQLLNARIKAMCIEEGVGFVDLYPAVPVTLIGPDGIHPRAEGYEAMASEWLKVIVDALEVKEPGA